MVRPQKEITVTIKGNEDVVLRVERFLALLHLSSAWGHSCTAAMDIDGDGSDRLKVEGIDMEYHKKYINKITGRPKTKSVDWVSSDKYDEQWK